jgi:hypothetical protein
MKGVEPVGWGWKLKVICLGVLIFVFCLLLIENYDLYFGRDWNKAAKVSNYEPENNKPSYSGSAESGQGAFVMSASSTSYIDSSGKVTGDFTP